MTRPTREETLAALLAFVPFTIHTRDAANETILDAIYGTAASAPDDPRDVAAARRLLERAEFSTRLAWERVIESDCDRAQLTRERDAALARAEKAEAELAAVVVREADANRRWESASKRAERTPGTWFRADDVAAAIARDVAAEREACAVALEEAAFAPGIGARAAAIVRARGGGT